MSEADRTIERCGNRFIASHGDGSFTFEMIYDQSGAYIGQYQDDVLGYGTIFLGAEIIDGLPCVNRKPIPNLTPEEMAAAS